MVSNTPPPAPPSLCMDLEEGEPKDNTLFMTVYGLLCVLLVVLLIWGFFREINKPTGLQLGRFPGDLSECGAIEAL